MNIRGVDLATLGEPIRYALSAYSARTDGYVRFDADAAAQLERTPNKPNSARSSTTVKMGGEAVGTLHVIAFAPWDGTGDTPLDAAEAMDRVHFGDLPRSSRFMPRSKTGIGAEAHFTLVSRRIDLQAEPALFAGRLTEFTLAGRAVVRAFSVGQSEGDFNNAMAGRTAARPTVTLTCGPRGILHGRYGEFYGNPHSIVNPEAAVQVCGFLAVRTVHIEALKALGAVEPNVPAV